MYSFVEAPEGIVLFQEAGCQLEEGFLAEEIALLRGEVAIRFKREIERLRESGLAAASRSAAFDGIIKRYALENGWKPE